MPRLNLPGWGVNRSWDLYYFLGLPVARSLLGSWHGLPGVPEHLSLEVTSPNLSWSFQKYTALHDRWLATVDYHRWHTNCSAGFIEPSWPMPLRRSGQHDWNIFQDVFLPWPLKAEVVSQPVSAWKPSRYSLTDGARTGHRFGPGWQRQPGRLRHSWIQQIGDGTPFSIRAEWSKARRSGHSGLTQRTSAVYAIWWWWWWSTCTIFSILWMIDSAWMHSIITGRCRPFNF